eukprot:CAMPEP_0185157732 /NCGR_PEP_ID=MMETSP1139-20130426/1963_1 /TAXON_ID=298111 /ORGANISM="Pavlova sp., Strain CCMP459" /LENGTH=69 /DNA_ID=CAMNT_0027722833 /DNA_START=27 /DNA_END=232 /DNA_ORIENTATION=+
MTRFVSFKDGYDDGDVIFFAPPVAQAKFLCCRSSKRGVSLGVHCSSNGRLHELDGNVPSDRLVRTHALA